MLACIRLHTSGVSATRIHRHPSFRRYIQTALGEAYLEPVPTHPGVTCLALNRPQAKNAISVKLLQEFHECLETVQFDNSVRVLVVKSSTPGSFCAGADLIERRTMSKTQVDKFLLDLRAALTALENLPCPTIAAIDGPALGGGLELGLACDLRVAGYSVTRIGLPETRLGIIPGAGGTQRLTRLLGLAKAKSLIFTARSLTASEALDFGVVDYISSADTSALDKALELAGEIAQNAPLALRAAKQAISRAPELSLETGLDFERASYEPLLKTSDRMEALNAFREKRPPVFKGE
ncbi:ClpP/crotonase [Laetiporus sulphureus 93-53]|uniref:ClpP/crotonase n=1 Tax=Laetiporus sulphureus 93-53 TaxID=1314785 RepID=A0A165F2K4_9APHY|nr:ClpP/crotonase [Laetiporus sulphureus 93-53]KZT08240.1 ClpP/crotonase [Laetiporus sulphureus 93-53]